MILGKQNSKEGMEGLFSSKKQLDPLLRRNENKKKTILLGLLFIITLIALRCALIGTRIIKVDEETDTCKPTKLYKEQDRFIPTSSFSGLDIIIKGLTKDNKISFVNTDEEQVSITQSIYTNENYDIKNLNIIHQVAYDVLSYFVFDGDKTEVSNECFKVDIVVYIPSKLKEFDRFHLDTMRTDINFSIYNTIQLNKLEIKNDLGNINLIINNLNSNINNLSYNITNEYGNTSIQLTNLDNVRFKAVFDFGNTVIKSNHYIYYDNDNSKLKSGHIGNKDTNNTISLKNVHGDTELTID